MLGDQKPRLALTFPDITMKPVSADRMLAQLATLLGKEVQVAGGLPADFYRFQQMYQFFNGEVLSNSFPIVLVAGNIDPLIITRSGWIPIGEKARATKVNGNVLLEIDDRPAIEYLKRYIPKILDDPQLFASYPIAILDESLGSDISKYFVIRSPFSYDKDSGAVVYAGEIPQNATVQLARGSRQDILSGTTDAAVALREKAAARKLNSLIFFSCAGRKMMLGLDTKKEMEALLKDVPSDIAVNGFYSYGEIGSLDSTEDKLRSPKFHNCTLVLCAF
jgi:hypothetical protein